MTDPYLLMRFEAPLMSFGAAMTEQSGPTWRFPGRAMLAGLLGNALGYAHWESDRLQALQDALVFGARVDRGGERVLDYQTVDLGQEFMLSGWTTAGRLQGRGGASATGTQIRRREYWADSILTVALRVCRVPGVPTEQELHDALHCPERPLFIGRKPCLPSVPLALGVVLAESLWLALRDAPSHPRADRAPWPALLPAAECPDAARTLLQHRTDDRDWPNQIHVGRRQVYEVLIGGTDA